MKPPKAKPQGTSGPISTGSDGSSWKVIPFPDDKAERENLIAGLFVTGFSNWVATQSEPSLAPFGEPAQNEEDDIDFTIPTALGDMAMELAEFAPLQSYGPQFKDAPKSLEPKEKADRALELIAKKSGHQGGDGRFLVIYATEHGFWLDPITIERMRRALADAPPRFERVYWISVHDLEQSSVSEIYPGIPHHIWGDKDLDAGRVYIPHPTEFRVGRTVSATGGLVAGGRRSSANITINYDLGPLTDPKAKK
jgi:hypothetical protein